MKLIFILDDYLIPWLSFNKHGQKKKLVTSYCLKSREQTLIPAASTWTQIWKSRRLIFKLFSQFTMLFVRILQTQLHDKIYNTYIIQFFYLKANFLFFFSFVCTDSLYFSDARLARRTFTEHGDKDGTFFLQGGRFSLCIMETQGELCSCLF